MPKNETLKSILILGSGPIVIGQACEFDYSGTQALRALREDGKETILINSNPATIMTDPAMADKVYLKPLTTKSIVEILKENPQIDGVLPTMGGQTALNLAIEADEKGIWTDFDVKLLGVDIAAINITEDREQFKQLMEKIDVPVAPAKTAKSMLEGKKIAQEFGLPLLIRASYTLGGAGAALVETQEEFEEALAYGLEVSPIHEVLIDKALNGWKEYELELLRDKNDRVIVVCNIENMDPMGVHTGDSITVAPALTINDEVYKRMRDLAIKMVRHIGDFAGGCNVQFSVSPDEKADIVAIEINPRVSRSSALASKATGFPIAKIATKLALGYTLDELMNFDAANVTEYFEPELDYVIVKIPRWNFDKFDGADRTLGPQMKSVGEVMGIGRNFQEALQKATQSLEVNRNGLGADGKGYTNYEAIIENLKNPSWDRVFVIYDAIQAGIPLSTIFDITKIDKWYLEQYAELDALEQKVRKYEIDNLPKDLMLEAKQKGFADRQIAYMLSCLESEVYKKRDEFQINRIFKRINTSTEVLDDVSPYYYSTFETGNKEEDQNESEVTDKKKILVLGSGPNRIGQGVEFDYCCVHGVLAAKECGYETIMINCNPETVSTDFDTADKLYFEPVFWEYIYDIIQLEKPEGVIVQLGGQTALKLAEKLDRYGIKIIGTSSDALDLAEDRGRFSELLKKNDIPYPEFDTAETAEEALNIADSIGFPLLVRPSYVLGGQGMKIVINKEELEAHVVDLFQKMPNNKLLLDRYLDGAIEAEADAICDGENVYIIGVMEHVEPCGIHSGDSNAMLPVFTLGDLVLQQIKDHTEKIALALDTVGLINVQFAIKDDKVYIIEANPRASRTVPFIAKAYGEPYVNYATKVMLGENKLTDFDFNPELKGYAIKEPIFSFDKFPHVNKQLGPEMKSTGESILFIDDLRDDHFYDIYARRKMYLSR